MTFNLTPDPDSLQVTMVITASYSPNTFEMTYSPVKETTTSLTAILWVYGLLLWMINNFGVFIHASTSAASTKLHPDPAPNPLPSISDVSSTLDAIPTHQKALFTSHLKSVVPYPIILTTEGFNTFSYWSGLLLSCTTMTIPVDLHTCSLVPYDPNLFDFWTDPFFPCDNINSDETISLPSYFLQLRSHVGALPCSSEPFFLIASEHDTSFGNLHLHPDFDSSFHLSLLSLSLANLTPGPDPFLPFFVPACTLEWGGCCGVQNPQGKTLLCTHSHSFTVAEFVPHF